MLADKQHNDNNIMMNNKIKYDYEFIDCQHFKSSESNFANGQAESFP